MAELIIAIVFILVMVAAVTALAFGAQKLEERTSKTWKKVGDELGLSFGTHQVELGANSFEAHRFLRGEIDGVPITIASGQDTMSTNRPKLTRGYVEITPPLPVDFAIRSNSLNEKIASKLLVEDVMTGDKAFDDALAVRCRDSAAVISLLTPQVRRSLLELSRQAAKVEVDKRGITATLHSYIDHKKHLRTVVKGLAQSGRAIAAARTELSGVRFDFDEPQLTPPATRVRLPDVSDEEGVSEVAAQQKKRS